MQNDNQSYLKDPRIAVSQGYSFSLDSFSTNYSAGIGSSQEAEERLKNATKRMYKSQHKLYAANNYSILLVFQAIDAAGKDSTIRSVFSGINPAGFQVSSFKAPSKLELDHDFLWRCSQALPERGRIGIFNRSHYEEVLVCKVHPEYILGQRIPGINRLSDIDEKFWNKRYLSIRNWEKHLADNGTLIMKFFLNVSRAEQKRRLLSRMDNPRKNWKYSQEDLKERALWPNYVQAFELAIKNTAELHAPWYIIPADDKEVMRAIVAELVADAMDGLNLTYPVLGPKELAKMAEAKKILKNEE